MSEQQRSATAVHESVSAAVASSWTSWHVDGKWVLGKVLETVREMLRDRGCEDVHGAVTVDDVEEMSANCEPVLVGGPSPLVVVYMSADDKTPVRRVRSVVEQHGDAHCIVMFSVDGMTPFAKKEVTDRCPLQGLQYRHYVRNITKHVSVPTHKKVTCPAGTDMSVYPSLLVRDPVSQYYDFRAGDLVEHVRIVGMTDPVPFRRYVT